MYFNVSVVVGDADLPLALGRTGRHGRGSRPSSRLRSASKLQSVKRGAQTCIQVLHTSSFFYKFFFADDNGSEEIEVSLPKKMAATPVCKIAKPTSSAKRPSQFDGEYCCVKSGRKVKNCPWRSTWIHWRPMATHGDFDLNTVFY
jgi:hypothetical protein